MSEYEEYREWKHEKNARVAAAANKKREADISAAPRSAEKPVAAVWSVMRNFHEAVRMSLKEQSIAVASGEFARARTLFGNMRRAIAEHAHLEDSVVFPLLARVGPLDVPGISKEHEEEERAGERVSAADNDRYPQLFQDYKASALSLAFDNGLTRSCRDTA